jgi:hypothetical protein
MKILITFEIDSTPIHAIDLFRLLKSRGHSLYFYGCTNANDPFNFISSCCEIINTISNFNEFDVWMFDLTGWGSEKTPFLKELENFKGELICINYEDGYNFFESRMNDYVIEKTKLYINNTLYLDRDRYHQNIKNKVMLTTSYIWDSQKFKDEGIPFLEKQKRAIFTGNITGLSETGNSEEYEARIHIPMALINKNIPCYYKIYGSDPNYKKIYENISELYKGKHLCLKNFVKETLDSMVILSIRGNGHTVRRYFEGLASNGLVFTTKFNHMVDFIGKGELGKHYIEIDWSGKDVVEKFKYYMNNLNESEIIANNGRKLWEEYSMLDNNNLLPQKVINSILSEAKKISGIVL